MKALYEFFGSKNKVDNNAKIVILTSKELKSDIPSPLINQDLKSLLNPSNEWGILFKDQETVYCIFAFPIKKPDKNAKVYFIVSETVVKNFIDNEWVENCLGYALHECGMAKTKKIDVYVIPVATPMHFFDARLPRPLSSERPWNVYETK